MERMDPQHKSSCCSRGPLAHILRNTAKKYKKIVTAFELIIHPSITNFPERMGLVKLHLFDVYDIAIYKVAL